MAFYEQLREASRPQHDKLESHPINQQLFHSSFQREDYHRYLALQEAICRSLETQLLPYKTYFEENGLIPSTRAVDAKEELTLLKITPLCAEFTFVLSDFPSAMAAYYLLQGSRHGAMVLLKQLQPLMPQHTFLFLRNDPSFFPLWKHFVTYLEECAKNENFTITMITAVTHLYTQMERYYDSFTTTSYPL